MFARLYLTNHVSPDDRRMLCLLERWFLITAHEFAFLCISNAYYYPPWWVIQGADTGRHAHRWSRHVLMSVVALFVWSCELKSANWKVRIVSCCVRLRSAGLSYFQTPSPPTSCRTASASTCRPWRQLRWSIWLGMMMSGCSPVMTSTPPLMTMVSIESNKSWTCASPMMQSTSSNTWWSGSATPSLRQRGSGNAILPTVHKHSLPSMRASIETL